MPLGMEVELGPVNIVLDEDPAPPKKGARHPLQLWLMYCGQTAALIKMPLGMEVGLGTGHIVLDGDPSPNGTQLARPNFRRFFLLWPNGWMDQDAMPLGREV